MSHTIAIVGAGPAGLSTAHFLAKAGIPHTLIDRAVFPRDKICGESYDGKVYHTLRRIDPGLPGRMQEEGVLRPGRQYQLLVEGTPPLPVVFSEEATPRLQGRRRAFDYFLLDELLQKGYTTWMPGTQVEKYREKPGGWELNVKNGQTIPAAAVVFAAGSKAPNPFFPNAAKNTEELLFYRMHVHSESAESAEDWIEFHLQHQPVPTCLALCPLGDGTYNAEVGLRRQDYRRIGRSLPSYLREVLSRRLSSVTYEGHGAGTSMQLHRYSGPLSGARWLVAGSAAIQVNPITGMGVGNAMRMGEIAAQLLIEQQAEGTSWSLEAYNTRVRQALRQEIRFSRLVTWLQHRPRWLRPVMHSLSRTKRVRHWLQQPDLVEQFTNPTFYQRR